MEMHQKISQYLERIEQEHQIKILLACETGSRAWGFPSSDSDFDIRIIYIHPKDWYLSLTEKKDSLDFMFENNEIDITGWDLRKSLRLLQKSNPPLLERIQSPIIYKADKDFVKEIQQLAGSQYSRIATIHHYLSMAKKFLDELESTESYKLKKFFYALRSAMACKWIVEKEQMPPIEFRKMLAGLPLEKQLVNRIEELIALKAVQSESYLHEGEAPLFALMHSCVERAETQRKSLPASNGSLKELDAFFLKMVHRYDD